MKSVREIMVETMQEYEYARLHEPEILRAYTDQDKTGKKKPACAVGKTSKEKNRPRKAAK